MVFDSKHSHTQTRFICTQTGDQVCWPSMYCSFFKCKKANYHSVSFQSYFWHTLKSKHLLHTTSTSLKATLFIFNLVHCLFNNKFKSLLNKHPGIWCKFRYFFVTTDPFIPFTCTHFYNTCFFVSLWTLHLVPSIQWSNLTSHFTTQVSSLYYILPSIPSNFSYLVFSSLTTPQFDQFSYTRIQLLHKLHSNSCGVPWRDAHVLWWVNVDLNKKWHREEQLFPFHFSKVFSGQCTLTYV